MKAPITPLMRSRLLTSPWTHKLVRQISQSSNGVEVGRITLVKLVNLQNAVGVGKTMLVKISQSCISVEVRNHLHQ